MLLLHNFIPTACHPRVNSWGRKDSSKIGSMGRSNATPYSDSQIPMSWGQLCSTLAVKDSQSPSSECTKLPAKIQTYSDHRIYLHNPMNNLMATFSHEKLSSLGGIFSVLTPTSHLFASHLKNKRGNRSPSWCSAWNSFVDFNRLLSCPLSVHVHSIFIGSFSWGACSSWASLKHSKTCARAFSASAWHSVQSSNPSQQL